MKHMPVLFVYDALCDEIYCATNVSGSLKDLRKPQILF